MSELDEIVAEFLVESYENLDRYDQDLLTLERDPEDRDALSSTFRTIHTVKGTCGFFGFVRLEAVAHVAENLLGRLRDGELGLDAQIASALLATGDAIRSMLEGIEATGEEGDEEHAELVATLERLYAGGSPPPTRDDGDDEDDATRLGALLVDGGVTDPDEVALALHSQELGDDRRLGEILVDQAQVASEEVDQALEAQSTRRSVADATIRVDVGMLDDLMNLVGELVLARNQIVQLVAGEEDSPFTSASQRLNLITTELQEGVMKTRMQPIGNIWNKLPRVVRDLALACDKRVELVMEGADTELDKTIIEAIKDPLTHLVRNAVDHGVEDVAARTAAGKPATGTLTLRAFHEGGQVNIEIADDGGGIDAATLVAKAVERDILSPAQAATIDERSALQLIFAPGFSTAAQVTNVSGRGVGMDVVRTNIERIGGTVDVATELGQGTTFKVKIPLTLAIIPALVVTSAGDRFAIPQLSLLELVRLEGETARSGIEHIHGTPVHRLRGRLLPIVDLREQLGQEPRPADPDVINIVVLQADGHEFGLVVDEITDTQEIVVKPLGSRLKETPLFAGATIMGDGLVALILDVLGIAEGARVLAASRDRSNGRAASEAVTEGAQTRTLLLVGLGHDGVAGRRAALDLAEVARLEEFPPEAVEIAGDREVVQYRGRILPLVHLGRTLGVHAAAGDGPMTVVVHQLAGRDVGLVVDGILDIVEVPVDAADHADHRGVVADGRGITGSAVIQDRVTDVVDASTVLRNALPDLADTAVPIGA